MLGEGVAERGKGVGPRRVGEGGWGKGGGEGGGEGGWEEALIEILNKTGIVTLILVYRNAHYETKSAEIALFGGFPQFFGRESPWNDITISQKNLIISPEKSENEMCERFHCDCARRCHGGHIFAHFKTLNQYYDKMGQFRVLKL